MRFLVFAIAFLIFLPSETLARQNRTIAPVGIRKILDRDYLGWQLPALSEDWIVKGYHAGKLKPYLISGDFDGDGRKDYALQIIHQVKPTANQERIILAFLRRGKSFKTIVLESNPYVPGDIDIILELVKKGTKGEVLESGKVFIYKNDSISVGLSDKAAHDYIWKDGQFGRVSTSD